MGTWIWNRKDTTYVYLAMALDGDLKIGCTWSLRVRMSRLKTQRGMPVDLAGYIPITGGRAAFEKEQELHNRFRRKGSRGEWHEWNPAIVRDFFREPKAVPCIGVKRG